jgi:hypothetical protein
MHRKIIISILSCVFTLLLFSCDNSTNNKLAEKDHYNNKTAKNMVESARHIGRLAKFPDSKTNFKIATTGSAFTRSFYITFKAPAKDIEKLIQNSPGLKNVKPQIYSKNYMLIEYKSYDEEVDYNHDFFLHHQGVPKWFTPEIKIKGRKYHIPYKKDHGIGGLFIVNDAENTVYIYVSWS